MSRRSRNSRAWHSVWSGIRRDADAKTLVLPSESDEWGCERLQYSDSDSEAEYPGIVPSVPSAVPVTGESYCGCDLEMEASYDPRLRSYARLRDCHCGEDDQEFDWVWDEGSRSAATLLSCENRKVSFHSEYSCGTAAIRGSKELSDGQHFWEIKMTSPVYGTDMMVGIGTSDVNLDKYRHTFCSLLGKDEDSWGLSYTALMVLSGVNRSIANQEGVGRTISTRSTMAGEKLIQAVTDNLVIYDPTLKGLLHHNGDKVSFSSRFGQGSIIGVHLDTWHGTLTFFKNRKCIGVAATELQNKRVYPMACSTAAKSSMKVIRSVSAPTSLQYLCCWHLRKLLPSGADALRVLPLPPGLRHLLHSKLGWVLSLDHTRTHTNSNAHTPAGPSSGSESDGCTSDPEACQRKRCRWT